jgi:50S ribosomal protein L16 3-hydroxylase
LIVSSKRGILGHLNPNEFLAKYWQKDILLVRSALAELPNFSANELAGLALEAEIESRLVVEDIETSCRTLLGGPFSAQFIQDLPPSHWSLLVQAVDHWVPDIRRLLDRFDFLPRWRLDDIMVSYSVDQGSVGPHFDNYDVFLLQIAGQKRWQIGQVCDQNTTLLADSPLRIMANFTPAQEYLLNPGDMLYLPPRVAHCGTALGDSMTFSIGFRSPTTAELIGDLATELLSGSYQNNKPYIDPPLSQALANGFIDSCFVESLKNLLVEVLTDDNLLAECFARFMTARKYPELDLITEGKEQSWQSVVAQGGLVTWHPASRYAAIAQRSEKASDFTQYLLAVDGELYPSPWRLAKLLCGQRHFSKADFATISKIETQLIDQLVSQGSLQIMADDPA